MPIFQKSIVDKYLETLDSDLIEKAYESYKKVYSGEKIKRIKTLKEEQYQGEFLIDLFVNVFGYIKNPTPDFNLTTELKNIKGSKKTDGAILKGEKTTEYRDITPYWSKRLEGRHYDVIQFRNGYATVAPVMIVEYKGLVTDDLYGRYAIQLGKILESNNVT